MCSDEESIKLIRWCITLPAACLGAVTGLFASMAVLVVFVSSVNFVGVSWTGFTIVEEAKTIGLHLIVSLPPLISSYLFVKFGVAAAPKSTVSVAIWIYLVGAIPLTLWCAFSIQRYPVEDLSLAIVFYASALTGGALPIYKDNLKKRRAADELAAS